MIPRWKLTDEYDITKGNDFDIDDLAMDRTPRLKDCQIDGKYLEMLRDNLNMEISIRNLRGN